MYLATKPPALVMRSAQQRWYAPMISRMSSGSSREESAVEPTRSQNMTVSWRRSADAAAWEIGAAVAGFGGASELSGVSVLPHFEQNFAPARLIAPQKVHRTGRAAPQASQNLL